jgi:hypothetical protein
VTGNSERKNERVIQWNDYHSTLLVMNTRGRRCRRTRRCWRAACLGDLERALEILCGFERDP